MTLTLAPRTEARLRNLAAQRGLPPEAVLDAVLAEAEGDCDNAAGEAQSAQTDKEQGLAETETGAALLARIRSLRLSGAYGDPALDSPQLARLLRGEAQARERD